MATNKIKHINLLLLIIMLIALPVMLQAQPEFEDDVEDVPFDGGISLMIAAGVAYSVKKVRDSRKKS